MTGRGIDQVLPHPSNPVLHEPYMKSAMGYVELAEAASGPIPRPVDFAYIWGYALQELERLGPDFRIINLETAITTSETYAMGKGIHYRMNPQNTPCITAAKSDCCCLANNHVLDWGYAGLSETLSTLDEAGVKSAGSGQNLGEARAPAIMDAKGKGRVLVFAFGSETSGIPWSWAARENMPGVNLLRDYSPRTVETIGEMVRGVKKEGDTVIFSVHWGANWGYDISRDQIEFAHRLIDFADIDVIHGHSSHHVKGIEVYKGKPILYGCGDFLNDYEGIEGHEAFRGDLGLMYFMTFNPELGNLVRLEMIPTQIRLFRVNQATAIDIQWMGDLLNREGDRFGTRVNREGKALILEWRDSC